MRERERERESRAFKENLFPHIPRHCPAVSRQMRHGILTLFSAGTKADSPSSSLSLSAAVSREIKMPQLRYFRRLRCEYNVMRQGRRGDTRREITIARKYRLISCPFRRANTGDFGILFTGGGEKRG